MLDVAQCSQKYHSLVTAKPRLIYLISRWRSMICHSREHISTSLESSGGVLPYDMCVCVHSHLQVVGGGVFKALMKKIF